MRLQHFVVEGNEALEQKALTFLSERAKCEQSVNRDDSPAFERHGLAMSRAYLDLAQTLGVGAGLFPAQDQPKAFVMSVERFKGEVVFSLPERAAVSDVPGLTRITTDDFLNMRDNANQALRAQRAQDESQSYGTLNARPR